MVDGVGAEPKILRTGGAGFGAEPQKILGTLMGKRAGACWSASQGLWRGPELSGEQGELKFEGNWVLFENACRPLGPGFKSRRADVDDAEASCRRRGLGDVADVVDPGAEELTEWAEG